MIGLPERRLEEPAVADVLLPLLCLVLVLVLTFVLELGSSPRAGEALQAATGFRAAPAPGRSVRIHVTGAGTIQVDGRRIELSSVHEALAQARFVQSTVPVTVSAEPSAQFSLVLRVLDACERSGAADVRFTQTRDSDDHEARQP